MQQNVSDHAGKNWDKSAISISNANRADLFYYHNNRYVFKVGKTNLQSSRRKSQMESKRLKLFGKWLAQSQLRRCILM